MDFQEFLYLSNFQYNEQVIEHRNSCLQGVGRSSDDILLEYENTLSFYKFTEADVVLAKKFYPFPSSTAVEVSSEYQIQLFFDIDEHE